MALWHHHPVFRHRDDPGRHDADGTRYGRGGAPKVREAVYETVLSIDGLAAAASDNDSPFDFLKDNHAQPDEQAEITEMGRMIRAAITKLPPKERTVVEYRFYRNMQVKDIARQVGLSLYPE